MRPHRVGLVADRPLLAPAQVLVRDSRRISTSSSSLEEKYQ